MKKSILSLLLVLTMVVSTFAALPMAASAETTYPGGVLIFEDFETSGDYESSAYEIGMARTANAISGKANTYISEEFAGLIVYQGNNTVTGTSYDYTTEGPDASLIIEYDIYFDDLVETGSTFLFRLRDADEYQKTHPLDTTFSATSITTAKATFDYQLQDDHWYHMRHIIKGTDSNTKPVRKHDLYIDGVAVITNGAFGSSSYYKFPRLDTLYLSLTAASTATETTAYMDNVCVYKANSSNAMPVDKGGLLAEIREAESILNSGNYSEATKTAAQEQIDIAKEVCTSSEANAEEVASAKTALAAYFENLEEDGEEGGDEEIIYPGGVLMYESFTGIAATGSNTTPTTTSQPKGTTAEIFKKRKGNDSGAGLGNYARQSDYSASSVIAEFDDASYFGAYVDDTTAVDEVAAQGPNAKLTLEFDHRMESLDVDDQTADLRIMIGTADMEGTMGGPGRAKSAASVFLKYPNIVNVYYSGTSANTYYLPDDMTIEQWHRYQLTLNLTNENSVGMSTFTFTVDGKNLVDANGNSQQNYNTILDSGAIAKAQLVSYYADVNGVDNVSVYKSNVDNEALSTAELMTKLHEINAKMALYRAAAEGIAASQLAAFETAVAAAGTMVTTAFGTYDATTHEAVTPAKTQADIDEVLASLISAEASLKAVLPYYGISEHTIDESGYITAVTVEEIKAYTGSPVKLIVATYDTDGLSDVSMMDFVGADVYELTKTLSVTNKEVAVFVWEMNDLEPLANTYYFGEAVVQD